jgi:hypothetical protein
LKFKVLGSIVANDQGLLMYWNFDLDRGAEVQKITGDEGKNKSRWNSVSRV